jgi:hypothetical protein
MRKILVLGLISMFFAATSVACNSSSETPAPEASASASQEASPAASMEASPAATDMSSPAAAASPAGS